MRKTNLAVTIIFILFITAVPGISLAMPDREFSPNENRYLAEPPKPAMDKIQFGEFQDGLEEYLKDQLCFRDEWITAKTAIQKACNNTDIGGAYVGKDGYDFEKITPEDVDEKQVAKNIRMVEDYFAYASATIDKERLSFLLIPTSGFVMAEKLPKNARLFNQSRYIGQVEDAMADYNFIDVRKEFLAHNREELYYRTDHHWTMDGAYLAYKTWCESTGHLYEDKDFLGKNILTEQFRGSLYSRILDADSAYDSIWTYSPPGHAPYGAHCNVAIDNKTTMEGCFDKTKLEEKDKYAYFFGGNYGEVHISSVPEGTVDTNENLLVIKDSFANSFVPLISMDYDNIYMVDLRYFNGNMKGYLKEHNITDVLVLYNISNFVSDKNIFKLVKER